MIEKESMIENSIKIKRYIGIVSVAYYYNIDLFT